MARGLRGSELPSGGYKKEGSGTLSLRRYPTSISDLVNTFHPLSQKLRMMAPVAWYIPFFQKHENKTLSY